MRHSPKSAFTLVELSIVLVIIGLLVGGVLTGQSLIRAAELKSITTQYTGYLTAVQAFRSKYIALPGDMTNATAFWGAADGSTGLTAACYSASSTTTTCNGDGDGKIIPSTGSDEVFRFWQQLALAGLISGSYDGVPHGSTGNCGGTGFCDATAANSPAGKTGASFWFAYNFGTLTNNTISAFDGQYDNTFEFGALTANNDPLTPILKPEDAWNIDTKLDDGMPATGKVVIRAVNGLNSCTNTTSNTTLTANYLLSNSTVTCALLFRQAF